MYQNDAGKKDADASKPVFSVRHVDAAVHPVDDEIRGNFVLCSQARLEENMASKEVSGFFCSRASC
jgi:hypothetical protein